MKRICKDCGKEFELTQGEIDFYEAKGLDLPKRCKECRTLNKKANAKAGATNGKSAKSGAQSKSSPSSDTKHETMATLKTGREVGWTAPKFIGSGIAAIVIVVAALLVAMNLGGITPNDLNAARNGNASSAVVANTASTEAATSNSASSTASATNSSASSAAATSTTSSTASTSSLTFRTTALLNEHYQKHGIDMGYASAEEYQAAAAATATDPNALHKTEAEDGDDVYFLESTGNIVFVSTDGYIRTFFHPDSGKAYFERQ